MALLPPTSRRKNAPATHARAGRHLTAADPILGRIIARVGPCALTPRPRHFTTLCDSIVAQQLSTTVAAVIFDRFAALYPRRRPTPERVIATPLRRLRSAGLSKQKAAYLRDLANGFLDGRIRAAGFAGQSNDEIIAALTSIHGVGRWTAEMFLIFSLNRTDILPVGDLGIQKAVQRWYGFKTLPKARTIRRIGKPWHPYESVASWYLWRSLGLD